MTIARQITFAPHGHILTNCNVWSRDGRRIVYDVRSDPAGDQFDGERIETVDVDTGEVNRLYQSTEGSRCGVVTFDPTADRVAFILGPERPTSDFSYGAPRRRGVMVNAASPGVAIPIDARDLVAPFTPGALRGGSHVHVFSPDGSMVAFTYEDQVLATAGNALAEPNQRNVGVSLLNRPVHVRARHERNHHGTAFTVLATHTVASPEPGSDEISRAFEDAWVGRGRQIAFQGHVTTKTGTTISEVFVVDLPDDLTIPGDGPLEGTETTRPCPPRGTVQRRLTYTADRSYPGIQGPRHWLRSSPDGKRIAFLMRDDRGIVQLHSVSPQGGPIEQLTSNEHSIASSFTWSPDGAKIAFVMDRSICVHEMHLRHTRRLTAPSEPAPRPEACVFSPDGRRIAFVQTVDGHNQVFVADVL